MCNYPEMIINKSEGLNKSEQELASLCEKCFLNMWSYPNLFKDKKKGKELCDLLVIAGDNILLLSDKSCKFNDEIDQDIAWERWYKKAVVDSINQLHQAKSWIEKFPTAIKLDPACKNNFPIVIDDIKNKIFIIFTIEKS